MDNERSVSPQREVGNLVVTEVDSGSDEGEDDEVAGGFCVGDDVMRVQREDCRRIRKIGDPRKPSEEEVREHELTHFVIGAMCACARSERIRIIGRWSERIGRFRNMRVRIVSLVMKLV